MYLWGPQKLNPYYDVYIPVITMCLRLSTENIPVHFEWPSRSGYFGGSGIALGMNFRAFTK